MHLRTRMMINQEGQIALELSSCSRTSRLKKSSVVNAVLPFCRVSLDRAVFGLHQLWFLHLLPTHRKVEEDSIFSMAPVSDLHMIGSAQ